MGQPYSSLPAEPPAVEEALDDGCGEAAATEAVDQEGGEAAAASLPLPGSPEGMRGAGKLPTPAAGADGQETAPAPAAGPDRQQTAAAVGRLKAALQLRHLERRAAAATAAAGAAAQGDVAAASPAAAPLGSTNSSSSGSQRQVYLSYSRRHSNPHFGGEATSSAEECQVIVQAADCASWRRSDSDDGHARAGSASLEVSSCDWEAELLVGEGAAEGASWAAGHQQQMQQLQVLTLIPNACYNG